MTSLLDMIGILIGFIAVILLLSILVTALVQATQATIRLRARNLKKGIETLLNNILGETKLNKKKAGEILNTRSIDVVSKSKIKSEKILRLIGSSVSYIDSKDLEKALAYPNLGLKKEEIDKLKSGINEIWEILEKQMQKRFLFFVRLITIVWAIAVAFYFQVSAPDLLNKLSIDPNLRAQYVSEALKMTGEVEASLNVIKNYQDVSEQALLQLEKQYPELKENLEEVSGIGKDKDSLLEELNIVLEGKVKNMTAILNSFEEILDGLYKEKQEKNLEQVRAVTNMLGRFNIYPWQYGNEFFLKEGALQWGNIVGILFTAALLSFGAPFWFERLKEVLKLKDILSKGIGPKEEK